MNDSICLPGRIAELLCLETSTVSGILDRMQKKGFIERVVNEENRREVFVKVTGRGQELKGPVLKVIEEINQRFWEDFTEEESDFIRGSLRKIAGKEL